MSDTLVLPEVEVFSSFDIEEELDNKEGHFRSVHLGCAVNVCPGMIIAGNCGVLYRSRGKKLRLTEVIEKCAHCIRSQGTKPCPFCNEML